MSHTHADTVRLTPTGPFSRLVESVFDVGAHLRHARVFHPRGIRLAGRFHADTEFEPWFGEGERAVIGRISKGVGLPKGVPDVLGLAFRVLDRDERPWDFALATTGQGELGRFVFTASRGWATARYGTLLPYRFGDTGLTWLFAEPDADQPESASLEAMLAHLRDRHLEFRVTAAGPRSAPRPVGVLRLEHADSHEYRTDFYDPVLNHPDEVTLEPEIITRIREFAYRGSREGRTD